MEAVLEQLRQIDRLRDIQSYSVFGTSAEDDYDHIARLTAELLGMPPPKAVCPDLVIGFKSMPYVMRYNHFPY